MKPTYEVRSFLPLMLPFMFGMSNPQPRMMYPTTGLVDFHFYLGYNITRNSVKYYH
jgi:hypothetical protein